MRPATINFIVIVGGATLIMAIAGAIRTHSFNLAIERANSLVDVVRTDMECQLLREAKLAIDLGDSVVANRRMDELEKLIEESRNVP